MKTVNIAFGIHNHQPVGNFDFVFEEAFQKAYLPFLGLLEDHSHMRMALHYTGILFQWLRENKPDFGERLAALVETGQIEMMTGGYYEPIMSVIPDRDKIGQIRKLTDFVKEHTGYDARGMWLAERIWEPHLAKSIHEAGVRYVVLDDSHFKNAGLRDSELHGYYLTEEQGVPVFLFPISEKLRYTVPFRPAQETVDYLQSIATEQGDALVVFADDGEKFGVWPGTYEHCYDDRWLAEFFEVLADNADWINILHFSEVLEKFKPRGRTYLPTASYREMMEWAMPTTAIRSYVEFELKLKSNNLHDEYKVFVRGGFWRNFMAKYPESNNMHKKMLHLSRRLDKLEARLSDDRLAMARDHIWAGQCNCPYWHGVFGGLYLPHLRFATYNCFLQAERIIDDLEHGGEPASGWIESGFEDLDCDGLDEVIVRNPRLNLYIAPALGGACFELDYKPIAMNVTDTMTRREESYHRQVLNMDEPASQDGDEDAIASIHDMVIAKEEGLAEHLVYDWYKRNNFIDHFLAKNTSLEQFKAAEYGEAGDFVAQPYEYALERTSNGIELKLWRHGRVLDENESIPVELTKTISVTQMSSRIAVNYEIRNHDSRERDFWFGPELNFSLLAGDADDRYYTFGGHKPDDPRLRSVGAIETAASFGLTDEWLGLRIRIDLDLAATVWRFPIETISQSEGGFERVYQSSVLLPTWKFALQPGASWQRSLALEIQDL